MARALVGVTTRRFWLYPRISTFARRWLIARFIPHPLSIPHPLKIPAQGVESRLNSLKRGREGKAQVAFAVCAEDDAGNCCDLCAVEQDVCGLAAVRVNARDIREGVESSGWILAGEAEFVESG